jgi:hypothetical protein
MVLALLTELVQLLWTAVSWYLSLMWLCLSELWSWCWEGLL